MWLVDTNVWSLHIRRGDKELSRLLRNNEVVVHELILLEISLGCQTPKQREWINKIKYLDFLTATKTEDLGDFLDVHDFYGSGLGAVDLQLLSALYQSADKPGLWTRDRAMNRAAQKLHLKTHH